MYVILEYFVLIFLVILLGVLGFGIAVAAVAVQEAARVVAVFFRAALRHAAKLVPQSPVEQPVFIEETHPSGQ